MAEFSDEFDRATKRYAEGEMVLLIDGSGGMIQAFGGETNPFEVAVEYGVKAKAASPDHVSARVFGDNPLPPLPLDGKEPAMNYFPGGPSNLLPAFNALVEEMDKGQVKQPAHIIIVSDGEIAEASASMRPEVIEKFTNCLRNHPDVKFDVIIPGHEESGLVPIMKEVARAVPDNPPRVLVVEDGAHLKNALHAAMGRQIASAYFAEVALTATQGVAREIMLSPRLRLRKPENA